ncbi:hypothetical protein PCE1_004784 [Barthelona sp. PCE]
MKLFCLLAIVTLAMGVKLFMVHIDDIEHTEFMNKLQNYCVNQNFDVSPEFKHKDGFAVLISGDKHCRECFEDEDLTVDEFTSDLHKKLFDRPESSFQLRQSKMSKFLETHRNRRSASRTETNVGSQHNVDQKTYEIALKRLKDTVKHNKDLLSVLVTHIRDHYNELYVQYQNLIRNMDVDDVKPVVIKAIELRIKIGEKAIEQMGETLVNTAQKLTISRLTVESAERGNTHDLELALDLSRGFLQKRKDDTMETFINDVCDVLSYFKLDCHAEVDVNKHISAFYDRISEAQSHFDEVVRSHLINIKNGVRDTVFDFEELVSGVYYTIMEKDMIMHFTNSNIALRNIMSDVIKAITVNVDGLRSLLSNLEDEKNEEVVNKKVDQYLNVKQGKTIAPKEENTSIEDALKHIKSVAMQLREQLELNKKIREDLIRETHKAVEKAAGEALSGISEQLMGHDGLLDKIEKLKRMRLPGFHKKAKKEEVKEEKEMSEMLDDL